MGKITSKQKKYLTVAFSSNCIPPPGQPLLNPSMRVQNREPLEEIVLMTTDAERILKFDVANMPNNVLEIPIQGLNTSFSYTCISYRDRVSVSAGSILPSVSTDADPPGM